MQPVSQRDFEAAGRLEDEQAALLSFHPIATGGLPPISGPALKLEFGAG